MTLPFGGSCGTYSLGGDARAVITCLHDDAGINTSVLDSEVSTPIFVF